MITKSVAANPNSVSTSTFPPHPDTSVASIPIDPCPSAEQRATNAYTGYAPNRVTRTSTTVASGASRPADTYAMLGW